MNERIRSGSSAFFYPLSAGVIAGSLLGLAGFAYRVTIARFIPYRMFRLAALTFREQVTGSLFYWTVSFLALSALLSFLEKHKRYQGVAGRTIVALIATLLVIDWTQRAFALCLFAPPFAHIMIYVTALGGVLGLAWLLTAVLRAALFKDRQGTLLRRCALCLGIPLAVLCAGVTADGMMHTPAGPNVIVIVVDTLRADHLGCYGYERDTSPHVDAFSRDAVLFTHAIAQAPWTTPSLASMLTSRYPSVLGIEGEPVVVHERFVTLAEIFRENNYRTGGIVSCLMLSSALGFDQGFDLYDEENARGEGYISSPSITEKAVSFIKKHRRRAFFLFLHYFDPHYDYILHRPYDYYPGYRGPVESGQPIQALREMAPALSADDIASVKALYDSEISYTDEHIGKIFDALHELGLYDDTIIVFTADHGEAFKERGSDWIGHSKTLYQELIHVPLVIKTQGKEKGKVVGSYVGLIDLVPTITAGAGVRIPGAYAYDGNRIDVSDEGARAGTPVFSETQRFATLDSVIWKEWKLIHNQRQGTKQLFYLGEDKGEANDLAARDAETTERLEKILKKWYEEKASKRGQRDVTSPVFTEEQKKHLKSLGYL